MAKIRRKRSSIRIYVPSFFSNALDRQFRPFANVLELAIALGWALVGSAYFIYGDAESRAVFSTSADPFDYIWAAFYLSAFPLIWAGVFCGKPHWRVAGLLLLGTGLLLEALVALTYPIEPRSFVYAVYAVAVFLRAAVIVRYFGTRTAV